jgi:hypothetical protein
VKATAFFFPFDCSFKMATQMSKKRKFCADGVFKAELNEMLMRELAEDGCVSAFALFT